ncbi:MAG TPA: DUF6351 family protein [Actinomycetota bacterium]|nr:DUF6351 family protein [Actinomycetota bacterium]
MLLAALIAVPPAPGGAAPDDAVRLKVLSNRADLISGGNALVEVTLPTGSRAQDLRVDDDGRDVRNAFAARKDGRILGKVEGLALGNNVITARLPDGRGASLTVKNHPIGGPVFSGPQIQPWKCQEGAFDKQCNAPTTYEFLYAPAGIGGAGPNVPGVGGVGSFRPYDPANPPSSAQIATTTTDQGVTVPYIIRVETGYMDRDQYAIAVLYDPAAPWTPFAPQPQWNRKLLITHGASCGIDHQTGTAPSVTDDAGLSRGFIVMSTALDNAGHNCNIVTQAESLIMAKEHLIESYGEIRYTIGTGCSGGSLVQYQVANAYPGVYQGILPQCSFPDAWSTAQQLADYHLVRLYVEHPERWGPGVVWDPVTIGAVEGHPNHVNSIILDELYFTATGDPDNPCAGVSEAERYNAQTNRKGVRCTLADYMINVFGPRPQDGFAGRPLDNVGVQYGLNALMSGLITPAQFADLNEKVGGADIDAEPTTERVVADRPALARAYSSGAINTASNLNQTAIIDLRGPDPGAFHDSYRAWAVRARLEREHGTHANQVIWGGAAPIIGDVNYTTLGLVAMDRWLAAVEKDERNIPLAKKIIADKPADIHDQCSDGIGHVIPVEALCPLIVPIYTTPRVVAGESIATDNNKCRLKPLRRTDYLPVTFTEPQWAQVQAAFPTGVCDWSKPGVDEQDTIPWQTYDGVVGGRGLGAVPASRPLSGTVAAGSPPRVLAGKQAPAESLPATGIPGFGAAWPAIAFAAAAALTTLRRTR